VKEEEGAHIQVEMRPVVEEQIVEEEANDLPFYAMLLPAMHGFLEIANVLTPLEIPSGIIYDTATISSSLLLLSSMTYRYHCRKNTSKT
jgi:hypothetical protein